MRSTSKIFVPAIAALILFTMASDSVAQQRRATTTDPILKGNPRRDAGGSCVYSRDGKVVFTPEGKDCRDNRDHLSELGTSDSRIVDAFPPAMRPELSKLLADHKHIATEVTRLRIAIRNKNQDKALEAAEKINSELTDHRAREERFFEAMARKTPAE